MKVQCPTCGKVFEYEDSRAFMFCSYCGTKVTNQLQPTYNQGTMLQQRTNAAPSGNVIVEYSTTKPQVSLMIVIDGEKWTFPNNARKEFTLSPGLHDIVFYVGRRGWRRAVNVPYGGNPVHISVLFAGRVKILIQ